VLSGLDGSVNGVGDRELVAKIHELGFRNGRGVDIFGGYCDDIRTYKNGDFITHCHQKLAG
jgi:hypothetical protein